MADQVLIRIIQATKVGGTCRSCRAGITWAKTFPSERAFPLHGNPTPVALQQDPVHGVIEVIAASDSHWAHCPDAPIWKRRPQ